MITKLVKRYYCEHCHKGGMTKAIAKHEESCIKNPARVCWVCSEFKRESAPLTDLITTLENGLDAVKEITDCPACILAAIVQSRIAGTYDDWIEFDYKAAMNEMHEDFNNRSFHEPISF